MSPIDIARECGAAVLIVALTGCYAPPPTDAQVQAVAATCKEHGMVARIIVGGATNVGCEAPSK